MTTKNTLKPFLVSAVAAVIIMTSQCLAGDRPVSPSPVYNLSVSFDLRTHSLKGTAEKMTSLHA